MNHTASHGNLQEKTVTPGQEVIEVLPDDGYYLNKVIVEGIEQKKSANGIITIPEATHEIIITHNLGIVPTYGYLVSEIPSYGSSRTVMHINNYALHGPHSVASYGEIYSQSYAPFKATTTTATFSNGKDYSGTGYDW